MVNVAKIKKNFNELGLEFRVFLTLLLCAKNGAGKISKKDLAKYLKASPQTVGKHLKTFTTCDIIKYRYSGEIMFNPEFYYNGEPENLQCEIDKYAEFRSNM